MAEIRDSANEIIRSVVDRERTDVHLPPLMLAVIFLVYVIIMITYSKQLYEKYTDIPLPQLFTLLALFTIGAGLLIAVFYLLMSRDVHHADRETKLRKAMIEYAESSNFICGSDVTSKIEELKAIDEKIDDTENMKLNKFYLILIVIPILVGALIVLLTKDTSKFGQIIGWSFVISVLIAILMTPNITTFPRKHEAATMPFFKKWNEIAPAFGLATVDFERTIGYRSFWVCLILMILTAGIYVIFWLYAMFRDMNKHFDEQWYFEDNLLKGIRSKELDVRDKGASRGISYTLDNQWSDSSGTK